MDGDIGAGRIDDAVLALLLPGEPLKVCARVNPGQGCAAWTFPTAVVSPAAQPCSGRHDGRRAWKGFDRDATDRLHRKGMISDPMGRPGRWRSPRRARPRRSGCSRRCSPAGRDRCRARPGDARGVTRETAGESPAAGVRRRFVAASRPWRRMGDRPPASPLPAPAARGVQPPRDLPQAHRRARILRPAARTPARSAERGCSAPAMQDAIAGKAAFRWTPLPAPPLRPTATVGQQPRDGEDRVAPWKIECQSPQPQGTKVQLSVGMLFNFCFSVPNVKKRQ